MVEVIKTSAHDASVNTTGDEAGDEAKPVRRRGVVEIEGGITVVVVDDDLSPKQQRALEDGLQSYGVPENVKVLDRTAIILEIFAQHAQSKEGQLQVELAMLQYRLNRGPKAKGGNFDSGCGFRGPGETKLETDKRVIRDKIVLLKREIDQLSQHRHQHRVNRLR